MMHLPSYETRRRGAIVPLFTILLIPLLGMLAFSIDLGYIALVAADLQTVADAAALAGAEKLQELYVQYNMPGQDAQGIWTTPSGGRVAWFRDPDGNVLSISEHPE